MNDPFARTSSPQTPLPFTSASFPVGAIANEQDKKELRIIKQAILKSAIEGGLIMLHPTESEARGEVLFLNRWIKWVFKYDDELVK